MPETTVLKVLLHCDGCVRKVKRHIRRLEGVESFHVDQVNSKVTVIGTVKPEVVLEKVLKAGKTAEFWPKEEASKAEETAEKTVVGEKKKKSSSGDEAGGSASKKQKKVETEELEDVGDGEIVDETHVLAADDESDERVLIKAKKPRKKGIFRKG